MYYTRYNQPYWYRLSFWFWDTFEEHQLRLRVPTHIADALSGYSKLLENPELRLIRQMLIRALPVRGNDVR